MCTAADYAMLGQTSDMMVVAAFLHVCWAKH